MSPKLRPLFLLFGFAGLLVLVYQLITTIQNLDFALTIVIAVPDMFFFYLAYLTYPPEVDAERYVN